MWPFDTNIDNMFDNIKQDIGCFANIGSMREERAEKRIRLTWAERDLQKTAEFSFLRHGKISVSHGSVQEDYRAFLAGPYMANLRHCAGQLLSLTKKCNHFIETRCVVHGDGAHHLSLPLAVNERVHSPLVAGVKYVESTRLLFVRAQAGMGKTVATTEMVRSQATKYCNGECDFLFFYIDAQGRTLTRIDEVISRDVSYYSVVFQASAVVALTRNGLLVPIIDGFDELIGSGGFADAFGSLSSLLTQLNRQGTIIATGRSAFYDENILALTANKYSNNDSLNYDLEDICLEPWEDEQIKEYLTQSCPDVLTDDIDKLISQINRSPHKEIFGKPFFIAELAEGIKTLGYSIMQKSVDSTSFAFLDTITKAYLDREKGKFLTRTKEPIMSLEGHQEFLEQLAMELWWQEKRSIDNETINVIAEILLEEHQVDPSYWQVFMSKAQSYAFLEIATPSSEKTFESPIYYNFFLSRALYTQIRDKSISELKTFLSRSLLDESIIDFLSSIYIDSQETDCRGALNKVLDVSKNVPRGSLAKQNAGRIIVSLLNILRNNITIEFSEVELYSVAFRNIELDKCNFFNCFFKDVSFYNSKLIDCTFTRCTITSLLLDNVVLDGSKCDGNTHFNLLTVGGSILGKQQDIHSKLISFGMSVNQSPPRNMNTTQDAVYNLLLQLLDKTSHRFQFDLNSESEPALSNLLQDSNWDNLQSLLTSSGVLLQRKRDRSGSNTYLYQLVGTKDELTMAIQHGMAKNRAHQDFAAAFWCL